MAEDGLSSSIVQFIEQYVRSVEQLEIILLLGRNPEQEFSVESVYQVIMSTRDSVQGWLDEMVSKNLAVCNPGPPLGYKFSTADATLLESAQRLGASYKAYPVRVIEAIYRPRKPQTDPAQDFADAFRLRKKPS
ncbi:hypothetical protein DES53_108296 [Roseimicrobium gellanilyticum]|uniref:Transcriptional regulator n=1 Tax=Roseimicrobium gellanilyticum TaxID=748857 RepID=A0A366HF88_9BACT|nr:hypothetical protein [Roseimicrobium gellanilyticum]RBP40589.1 hypothetical protein DES53_108296 [Roseimicrobium gellanilyticum]